MKCLRNLLHQTRIHGHAADAARRSHQPIEQNSQRQPRRKRSQCHGESQQQHGQCNRPPRAHAPNQHRSIQRAQKCADAPSAVEPSIAGRSGMKHAIAERSRDYHPGHHRAQKQSPTRAEKNHAAMPRKKSRPSRISRRKRPDRSFCRLDIMTQLNRPRHHMPPLAHREVAAKRNDVGADVDQQHSAEADVLIDKSNDRAGNQPSTLNPASRNVFDWTNSPSGVSS